MTALKAVAIVGDGDTSYENARDLLDDRIPEGCQVYIPSYIKGPGLKNVHRWLNDYDVSYERVPKDKLIDRLRQTAGLPALIVVGTEGLESEISQSCRLGIPVYDLSKALWAVPDPVNEHQMPLGEPESHAETTKSGPDISVRVTKDLALATVSEPRSQEILDPSMLSEMLVTRSEVEEIVRAAILHHEENWHSPPLIKVDPVEEIDVTKDSSHPIGNIKYYKSKTGKYRKAGRSKARPGEVEAWLTEDEIDDL